MLSSLFASTQIPVLEQVVKFSQARHGVLAGNIANLDTPGYHVRDLSPELFQSRLKAAIQAQRTPAMGSQNLGSQGAALMGLASQGDSGRVTAPNFDAIKDVGSNMKSILRHDDGNVGLDQQITAVAKNQMQHNMAIALLSSQFRLLQAAITERA
jgi:flagellar basal-body rod protein FlgB